MNKDHFLNIGNPSKAIRCLEAILTPSEVQKLRDEIKRNVRQLVTLCNSHMRSARNVAGQGSWRQRISRAYYACYCMSRAVRLAISGAYNTDPSDHKSIGDLPSDFPDSATWSDLLTKFRGDRNISDYDHTACRGELEHTDAEYLQQAQIFIRDAKDYLKERGHL